MRWHRDSTGVLADGGDAFTTDYRNESPTEAIVRSISAIENCSIEEVPTIYDYVDADSMDRLMTRARDSDQDVTLHLTVEEYDVSVDSDGTISIRDLDSSEP